MDIYSLVTNTRTAEFIFNLSVQIIIVSLLGWAAMKIWRPKSAPARSAGILAILITLAAIPVFTIMFSINQVTWFQSTIELPHASIKQQETQLIPVPEIFRKRPGETVNNLQHDPLETIYGETESLDLISEPVINSEIVNQYEEKGTENEQHESLHRMYEKANSSLLANTHILIPKTVTQDHEGIADMAPPLINPNLSNEKNTAFLTGDQILLAANIFGIIWLTGFFIFILRLGFKLSFLKGYMHNLSANDSRRLKNIYNSIRHLFNDRPMPEIYFSASLSSPVTVGIIRPIMILPMDMEEMPDDELKSILLHELAHIFHRDNLIGFLQHIISAVFWWNPLIYFLNALFSDSREDVCDNYALRFLKSPKKYADTLISLAEKTYILSGMPATAGMSLSRRSLERRVMGLLMPDRDLGTIYKPSFIILSIITAIIISSSGPGLKLTFKETVHTEDTTVMDYRISSSPGTGWTEQPSSPFNDKAFVLPSKLSMIYIGRIPINENNSEVHPADMFMLWLEGMQNKNLWKNVSIESSGTATIDGLVLYYATYQFMNEYNTRKEKVYFIRGESSFYRIRYSCPKINYMDNLGAFERYVKSFKLEA